MLERESVARNRGTGVCLNPLCPSKMPVAQHLGESFPSAIMGSLFVRIREIKKEERNVESVQTRAAFAYYFPLENIKGNLTVIMLEMLPVPLPFHLSSVYDTVPGM